MRRRAVRTGQPGTAWIARICPRKIQGSFGRILASAPRGVKQSWGAYAQGNRIWISIPRIGPFHSGPAAVIPEKSVIRGIPGLGQLWYRDTLNKSSNASAFTPSFLRKQEPKTLWKEVPAFAGTTGRDKHPGHGLIQRFHRPTVLWTDCLDSGLRRKDEFRGVRTTKCDCPAYVQGKLDNNRPL